MFWKICRTRGGRAHSHSRESDSIGRSAFVIHSIVTICPQKKEYNKEVKYVASLLPKRPFARIALALFVFTATVGSVYLSITPTPEEKFLSALEEKVPMTDEQKQLVSTK